jgi:hypothetical protein
MLKINTFNTIFLHGNTWSVLSLPVIGIFLYNDILSYSFILYDDLEYINRIIINTNDIRSTLNWVFTGLVNNNWSPLTLISLVIDYKIYGDYYGGYHLTSLIIHILNSILVYFLFREILNNKIHPYLIALIFLVHPLNVETVTWIAERKGVLSAFFSLGSILLYLKYKKSSLPKTYYLVSLVLFILALMTKAVFVTLPLIFLLILWYRDHLPIKKLFSIDSIITVVPFLVVSLVFILITFYIHNKTGALVANEYNSLSSRIYNANNSYFLYLYKVLYPFDLSIYYPFKEIPIYKIFINFGLIIAVSYISYMNRFKRRYVVFGVLWYTILVIPVIGIIQTGAHSHADRYTYLPLIGIFLIIFLLLSELMKLINKNFIFYKIAGIFFIVILMIISYVQNKKWRSNLILFQHAYEIDNENYIATINLSRIYIVSNNISKGMLFYEKSKKLVPNSLQMYELISHDLDDKNEHELVIYVLNDLIRLNNVGVQAYLNIATLRVRHNDYRKAINILLRAKKSNVTSSELDYLLAYSYFQINNKVEAENILKPYSVSGDMSVKMNLLLEEIQDSDSN